MKVKVLILFLLIFAFIGCKKLLEIPNPENIRTPEVVFATEASANEAIAGIYNTWKSLYNKISSPSIVGGLTSDELQNYYTDQYLEELENNDISSSNPYLPWADLYNIIYQTNAAIEGLNNSKSLTASIRNYHLGEARFIRAYSYFVLVNFFGDVPLLVSTDVKINQSASRSSADSVYLQIVNDLLESESLMETGIFEDEYRFRVNKLVVSAFLARVYLYRKDWNNAEIRSSQVINSGKYHLVTNIDSITVTNNAESLFQFDNNGIQGNIEARAYIFEEAPVIVLRQDFISSFEGSDLRISNWTSSKIYQSKQYYYPFKYKSRDFESNERYTMLRLAEQYLIRSEARANNNRIEESVEDINKIRGRVNLPLINSNISLDSCLALVFKERRHELFAETSHRWFDLKRSGNTSEILSKIKPTWQPTDTLYPLPYDDIIRNRSLIQNHGYE